MVWFGTQKALGGGSGGVLSIAKITRIPPSPYCSHSGCSHSSRPIFPTHNTLPTTIRNTYPMNHNLSQIDAKDPDFESYVSVCAKERVYPSRKEGVGDLGRLYAQAETFPRKDVPIWYNGGFTVFMYYLAAQNSSIQYYCLDDRNQSRILHGPRVLNRSTLIAASSVKATKCPDVMATPLRLPSSSNGCINRPVAPAQYTREGSLKYE
jgi:hypothetical protein